MLLLFFTFIISFNLSYQTIGKKNQAANSRISGKNKCKYLNVGKFLNNYFVILHYKNFIYFEEVMRILKQNLFLLIVIFLTSCSVSNEYLPEEFIGLRLTKKVTGKEARNFVNKL
ncbi:MAG TPA: hypothetical protein ENI76_07085, partial [Ignavibacteria bacterium]|nr:hypothetical protein [Ignavibacteria bacterium]